MILIHMIFPSYVSMFTMATRCSHVISNQTSTTWESCNGFNHWCSYESQIVVQVRYLQRRLEQILGMSEKSRLLPPKKMVISLGKNFLR